MEAQSHREGDEKHVDCFPNFEPHLLIIIIQRAHQAKSTRVGNTTIVDDHTSNL